MAWVALLGPAPQQGGGGLLRASAPAPAPRTLSPVAPPAPVATSVAAAETSSFWVQAGLFADAGEAGRIADSLSGWVRADGEGGRYRVVVGPWDSANAAEAARLSVMARGYSGALLISGR